MKVVVDLVAESWVRLKHLIYTSFGGRSFLSHRAKRILWKSNKGRSTKIVVSRKTILLNLLIFCEYQKLEYFMNDGEIHSWILSNANVSR